MEPKLKIDTIALLGWLRKSTVGVAREEAVGVTLPHPSVFWNHEVRAGLDAKIFRTKDLFAKYCGIRS
jgi:hypothetical protein